MKKYLAFVDYLGKSIDGKYVYRFDFTVNPNTVWGDYFNIAPAVIIPDLQPEEETISKSAKVNFDKELNIAKKNGCFSMQDCFDGIISLAFTELTEDDTIYCDDEPLRFDFGEPFELVEEKLKSCGYSFFDIIDEDSENEEIINDLIEKTESVIEEDDDEDFTLSFGDGYQDVFSLKVGDKIRYDYINEQLFNNGYTKVEYVEKEGQFVFRGHIIDIFSYKQEYPIRISFFGDDIEKIFKFDEQTQKEVESIEEVTIYGKVNDED